MPSRSTIPRHPRPARPHPKAPPRQVAVAMELAEEFKKHQIIFAERNRSSSLTEFGLGDLSPIPLALLSRRGVIVSAGKPLFDLFQASSEDVLFHSIPEFLAREDVIPFYKFLNDVRNKRRTQRAEFMMAVKERFPKRVLLLVSALEAPDSDRLMFRVAFVELTENEQRASDPRIPAQDTRLMEVIDGIVWEADYPMRFSFVSRQVEHILGFTAKDWINDPDFWAKHIYHEDRDRVLQGRAQAAKKLSSHVLHYRMLTASRKVIHVKDSAVTLAGAPGWTKMSGIITDVTDLEHARQNLKHANESLEVAIAERTSKMQQSLDAMETLCYGIAHDLKAPLRGLHGFIGILMNEYGKLFDDDAKLYAHRCELAVARMGELIEGVLLYGRLNHTLPELLPVHLKPLIDRILATMEPEITAKSANIQVQMSFPTVLGNPFLLEQVFTNLISNALKFTRPGAHPEISISGTLVELHDRPPTSDLRPPISDFRAPTSDSPGPPIHKFNPHTVRLTVTDNGIGIPPEGARRMFGMFQKFHRSEEYAGTGIGLAIVKRAVELMSGHVGVFSEPNHGSSFWIELPAA